MPSIGAVVFSVCLYLAPCLLFFHLLSLCSLPSFPSPFPHSPRPVTLYLSNPEQSLSIPVLFLHLPAPFSSQLLNPLPTHSLKLATQDATAHSWETTGNSCASSGCNPHAHLRTHAHTPMHTRTYTNTYKHTSDTRFIGNYARPRRYEVAAAINRLRTISFRQTS